MSTTPNEIPRRHAALAAQHLMALLGSTCAELDSALEDVVDMLTHDSGSRAEQGIEQVHDIVDRLVEDVQAIKVLVRKHLPGGAF